MIKKNKVLLFFTTILIFFCLLGVKKTFENYSDTKIDYKYLSLFSEVVSLVKTNYVEDVRQDEKFPFAFASMLNSLDKFSSYLDAEKTKIYDLYQKGISYSAGIYGNKSSNYFQITDVLEGSPAYKAGLKSGDIIKAVNGDSIFSKSFWEMYLSLLSQEPENIELDVFKRDSKRTIKVSFKTDDVKSSTEVRKIEENIYFVSIPRFDKKSLDFLKSKLQGKNNINMVIDLRKYSGGDFKSFREIAGLLFREKINLIVKMKGKTEMYTLGSSNAIKYNSVVIINRSTILYGELLASIFQSSISWKKGSTVLMGERTDGFIPRLGYFGFSDNSSIILTDGLFFIDDKNLSKLRVKPDIKLKETDTEKIVARCISILKKS